MKRKTFIALGYLLAAMGGLTLQDYPWLGFLFLIFFVTAMCYAEHLKKEEKLPTAEEFTAALRKSIQEWREEEAKKSPYLD